MHMNISAPADDIVNINKCIFTMWLVAGCKPQGLWDFMFGQVNLNLLVTVKWCDWN